MDGKINRKLLFSIIVIPLLLLSLVFLLTFKISSENHQINEEKVGVIFLLPSERNQIQEIRKSSDVLIVIPQNKEIFGTSKNAERDSVIVKQIVNRWFSQPESINKYLNSGEGR